MTMEGKDSEDVRREMLKEDPKKLGVRVERMIKTRKGLVVAVSNRMEKDKLLQSETLKEKGYVVREGEKRYPKNGRKINTKRNMGAELRRTSRKE